MGLVNLPKGVVVCCTHWQASVVSDEATRAHLATLDPKLKEEAARAIEKGTAVGVGRAPNGYSRVRSQFFGRVHRYTNLLGSFIRAFDDLSTNLAMHSLEILIQIDKCV